MNKRDLSQMESFIVVKSYIVTQAFGHVSMEMKGNYGNILQSVFFL